MDFIRLKDGKDICIADKVQFADLVREVMGDDAYDYLDRILDEYEDKLVDLRNEIDSMQEDIQDVDIRLADKDEDIDALNDEIIGLNEEVAKLEKEIEKLRNSDREY